MLRLTVNQKKYQGAPGYRVTIHSVDVFHESCRDHVDGLNASDAARLIWAVQEILRQSRNDRELPVLSVQVLRDYFETIPKAVREFLSEDEIQLDGYEVSYFDAAGVEWVVGEIHDGEQK